MEGKTPLQLEDEANLLLDPQCAVATSPAARALKARLRASTAEACVTAAVVYMRTDCANLLRCALAVGVSPDSRFNGTDPLCALAANSSMRCFLALLAAGANVKAADKNGCTPLHCTATSGNAEGVRLLLKARAVLEATDVNGCTPLLYACEGGHMEVV